ncbi:MAG TPA: hypothetical protein VG318_11565, partial [Actinomycetota bacterium]|nr:hypothetical protein [Actinomycetota bacterium]
MRCPRGSACDLHAAQPGWRECATDSGIRVPSRCQGTRPRCRGDALHSGGHLTIQPPSRNDRHPRHGGSGGGGGGLGDTGGGLGEIGGGLGEIGGGLGEIGGGLGEIGG